jgi:hypothetical protein
MEFEELKRILKEPASATPSLSDDSVPGRLFLGDSMRNASSRWLGLYGSGVGKRRARSVPRDEKVR